MNCSNCGSKTDKRWKYCPDCGICLGGECNDVFNQAFREMEELTKRVGMRSQMDMEVIDISKVFNEMIKNMENPKRRGFSIRIHQKNDEKPRISFRKYSPGKTSKTVYPELGKPAEKKGYKLGLKLPKETEEPDAEIKRYGNRILVDVALPGVKDSGDIDIHELDNSIEIKALAGNRGYFKIIKKPEFSRIIKKSFNSGVLRVELL